MIERHSNALDGTNASCLSMILRTIYSGSFSHNMLMQTSFTRCTFRSMGIDLCYQVYTMTYTPASACFWPDFGDPTPSDQSKKCLSPNLITKCLQNKCMNPTWDICLKFYQNRNSFSTLPESQFSARDKMGLKLYMYCWQISTTQG